MSWGVGAIGKVPAVRVKLAAEFAKIRCSEPEETVKKSAAATIDAALAAQDPDSIIRVSANGSQSFKDYSEGTGVTNQLIINIEPVYGFVE